MYVHPRSSQTCSIEHYRISRPTFYVPYMSIKYIILGHPRKYFNILGCLISHPEMTYALYSNDLDSVFQLFHTRIMSLGYDWDIIIMTPVIIRSAFKGVGEEHSSLGWFLPLCLGNVTWHEKTSLICT